MVTFAAICLLVMCGAIALLGLAAMVVSLFAFMDATADFCNHIRRSF